MLSFLRQHGGVRSKSNNVILCLFCRNAYSALNLLFSSFCLQAGQPAPPAPAAGTQSNIQRHEVDHLIRASNDITQQINNLKYVH